MTVHTVRAISNIAMAGATVAVAYITGTAWALLGLLFIAAYSADSCKCEDKSND